MPGSTRHGRGRGSRSISKASRFRIAPPTRPIWPLARAADSWLDAVCPSDSSGRYTRPPALRSSATSRRKLVIWNASPSSLAGPRDVRDTASSRGAAEDRQHLQPDGRRRAPHVVPSDPRRSEYAVTVRSIRIDPRKAMRSGSSAIPTAQGVQHRPADRVIDIAPVQSARKSVAPRIRARAPGEERRRGRRRRRRSGRSRTARAHGGASPAAAAASRGSRSCRARH